MTEVSLQSNFRKKFSKMSFVRPVGRIANVRGGVVGVQGLGGSARMGSRVLIRRRSGGYLPGEVIQLNGSDQTVLPEGPLEGVALEDRVILTGDSQVSPDSSWLGRIIDPDGLPLDGHSLKQGVRSRPLQARPPSPADRRALGDRLKTGLAIFNTILPIVEGQRIGLFAGSGVGKSNLLGTLATKMQADVVVIGLIGERGREVRHFVDEVLGPDGLKRSVVVAATSDQSPLARRRCAWTAMAVAEHFRDMGQSVLLLADSITRFAEAHREVAVAAGEAPVLRGYPPSTSHMIMSLCERAGPGTEGQGDITGVFSVLVAGSDMDEPVADILRGVLDGHAVLDRAIAERGRFPAVDVLRSVSRSLPNCASSSQNASISTYRRILSAYSRNEMMVTAGLYSHGSDPEIDQAIALWPDLDAFAGRNQDLEIEDAFMQLDVILRRAKSIVPDAGRKTGPRSTF